MLITILLATTASDAAETATAGGSPAATARLDTPTTEARLAAVKSREAEMTAEEHDRYTALLERVKAMKRTTAGAVESHPVALEAAEHTPAPAVDSAADSAALYSRLAAIKGKIEASSELASDRDIQAALSRADAKFECERG